MEMFIDLHNFVKFLFLRQVIHRGHQLCVISFMQFLADQHTGETTLVKSPSRDQIRMFYSSGDTGFITSTL
jgi:hypothetical protein